MSKLLHEADNISVVGWFAWFTNGYDLNIHITVLVNWKMKSHILKLDADEEWNVTNVEEWIGVFSLLKSLGYSLWEDAHEELKKYTVQIFEWYEYNKETKSLELK